MTRLPTLVFGVIVAATAGAFFVVQHLKVTTPLLVTGARGAPTAAVINPLAHNTCAGVQHGQSTVSFYLLHRSDSVDVYVLDASGTPVATLATGRFMPSAPPKRISFTWNGLEDNGTIAPDGVYTVQADLIHQGRSIVLSPGNGAPPFTIKVKTQVPRPVVASVTPFLVPQSGQTRVDIRFTGNEGHAATIKLYRTDLPGGPKLVKTFVAPASGHAVWDGLIGGLPAPAGVYLVGLEVTDAACNTGRFPARIPPPPGSTPRAGVTVRYIAAEPPLTPVPAGTRATVNVDSRGEPFTFALRAANALPRQILSKGSGSPYVLRVRLPRRTAGLYALSVRVGTNATKVPLIASASRPAKVLVVLPALTWQGENPVDDMHDGLPSTLTAGAPVLLDRPLANGLPAGFADETALVTYLAKAHLGFDLTTDLGLIDGVGPQLAGHTGVILAGSERWIPPKLASDLRSYVQRGGHVLSLGLQSLRGSVTLTSTAYGPQAYDPTGPSEADIFGVRHRATMARGTEPEGTITDQLSVFAQSSGIWSGFTTYEPIIGVAAPAQLATTAGFSGEQISLAGVRLGKGSVVEVGLPGFASALAHNNDVREIFAGIWSLLTS